MYFSNLSLLWIMREMGDAADKTDFHIAFTFFSFSFLFFFFFLHPIFFFGR